MQAQQQAVRKAVVHIVLAMLQHGWRAGDHPFRDLFGSLSQPKGQWQRTTVASTSPPATLSGLMEMHGVMNAAVDLSEFLEYSVSWLGQGRDVYPAHVD